MKGFSHFSLSSGEKFLILIALILLTFIIPFDYSWTVYLYDHHWPQFADFMRRSLFEGEAFGGNDPVIFFQIGLLFFYFWLGWDTAPFPYDKWRPWVSYLIVCVWIF